MKKVFALSSIFILIAGFNLSNINRSFAEPLNKDVSIHNVKKYNSQENLFEEIRLELEKNNISKDIQNSLIDKLKRGEQWDSMNPQKISQIPDGYFKITEGVTKTKRYTFEDGSFIEQVVDVPIARQLRSVSGWSVSNGTGYHSVKGAKVVVSRGICSVGFFADYTINNRANDRIDKVYDEFAKVIAGSYSNLELELISNEESANGPAEAKVSADITYVAGIGASNREWIKLLVGDDKVWTSEN